MTKDERLAQAVYENLENVLDPELGISVVDLGLIYDVKAKGETILIEMTLTQPSCPMVGYIQADIKEKALAVPGVKEVKITLTFDPPWSKEMVSDDIKKKYGLI